MRTRRSIAGTASVVILAAGFVLPALGDGPDSLQKAKVLQAIGSQNHLLSPGEVSPDTIPSTEISKESFLVLDKDRDIEAGQDTVLVDPNLKVGKFCSYKLRAKALAKTALFSSNRRIKITCVETGTSEFELGGHTTFHLDDPILSAVVCQNELAKLVLSVGETGTALGAYATIAAGLVKGQNERVGSCGQMLPVAVAAAVVPTAAPQAAARASGGAATSKVLRVLAPGQHLLSEKEAQADRMAATDISAESFILIDKNRVIEAGQDEAPVDPALSSGIYCTYVLRTKGMDKKMLHASDRKIKMSCVETGMSDDQSGTYSKFELDDPDLAAIVCHYDKGVRFLTVDECGKALGTSATIAAGPPAAGTDRLATCSAPAPATVAEQKKADGRAPSAAPEVTTGGAGGAEAVQFQKAAAVAPHVVTPAPKK